MGVYLHRNNNFYILKGPCIVSGIQNLDLVINFKRWVGFLKLFTVYKVTDNLFIDCGSMVIGWYLNY